MFASWRSALAQASWSSCLFWCQPCFAEYTMLSTRLSNWTGVSLLLWLCSVVTICIMELWLLGMLSLIRDRKFRPILIDASSLSSRMMLSSGSISIPSSKICAQDRNGHIHLLFCGQDKDIWLTNVSEVPQTSGLLQQLRRFFEILELRLHPKLK